MVARAMAGPLSSTVVHQVPQEWRRPDVQEAEIDWDAEPSAQQPPFFAYHSLAEVFPDIPLDKKFNSDASFRRQLREAARDDLFVPLPKLNAEQNAMLRALDSSVQAKLVTPERKLRSLPRLTQTFKENGLELSGQTFVARLLGLCGGKVTGGWMDIVGSTKQRKHGWHQDTGRGGYTVMLGFPASDRFIGEGVFSHAARISHLLRLDRGIPIVLDWVLPEEAIFRPVYAPGQEIITYSDSAVIHSAPDKHDRESVWRLM